MVTVAARRVRKNFRFLPREEGECLSTCASLHHLAEALGNAVDARDSQLYRHSRDVAEVSCVLAHAMGLSREEIDVIHIAGHLHDIGKIGIPDAVLKKQGPLDGDEWSWIRRHPGIGAEIVRPVPALNGPGGVADIILCHHERFDGKGYPAGLEGDGIPHGARIVAVADTLSALLRNRSYRVGCSFDLACAEIRRCSGSQFDPVVVKVLEKNRQEVARCLAEGDDFFRCDDDVPLAPSDIVLAA
jgi:HD-GYP domain-containing protein (c-di-GMP phosphodiesterase class II)